MNPGSATGPVLIALPVSAMPVAAATFTPEAAAARTMEGPSVAVAAADSGPGATRW